MTVINDADLNSYMSSDSLVSTRAALPAADYLHFEFDALTSSVAAHRRKRQFVVPADCYLETVAVHVVATTTNNVITVSLTGNGAFLHWPVSLTEQTSSTSDSLTRTLFDNSYSKLADKGFRALTKGTTMTIEVANSTTNPVQVFANLVLRQFYGRK